MNIVVYSKNNCVWCDRAKNLLDSVNLPYDEIDLSDDTERSEFYKKIGEGVKTVPQIFIDDIRVGGYPCLLYTSDAADE